MNRWKVQWGLGTPLKAACTSLAQAAAGIGHATEGRVHVAGSGGSGARAHVRGDAGPDAALELGAVARELRVVLGLGRGGRRQLGHARQPRVQREGSPLPVVVRPQHDDHVPATDTVSYSLFTVYYQLDTDSDNNKEISN